MSDKQIKNDDFTFEPQSDAHIKENTKSVGAIKWNSEDKESAENTAVTPNTLTVIEVSTKE